MEEKNEKLGLLLLFDCIAVILSTYGILLLFQLLSKEVDTNVMIVSCFFVGIKILVMGIGDITGISKKFLIAGIFILVADIIVFAINYFMAFGISMRLIGITLVADIIIIIISHLLWGKLFSNGKSEKKQRKDWLNNPDEDQVEEEYDDIFESLVTKDGNTNELDIAAVSAHLATQKAEEDDEVLFEDEELDDEEFEHFGTEEAFEAYDDEEEISEEFFEEDEISKKTEIVASIFDEDDEEDTYLDEEAFNALLINPSALSTMTPEEEVKEEDAIGAFDLDKEDLPEEDALEEEPIEALEEVVEEPENIKAAIVPEVEALPVEPVSVANLLGASTPEIQTDENPAMSQQKEDFVAVEKRLGALLTAINTSTQGTAKLEETVNAFKTELDNLTPITTDRDILKTGDVIRDKLKSIIDKQFIVDEVLDDLIRLSQQINGRIDDLDSIEADLKKRKAVLDKKELLYMNRKPVEFEDVEVQILPDEIMLENDDSEIIIDQGDLATIKKYLEEHPNL